MNSYIVHGSDKVYGKTDSTIFRDSSLKIGVVIEEVKSDATGETNYIVLVNDGGNEVPVSCVRMSRFGGVHNYEEYNYLGYNDPIGSGSGLQYSDRPGDVVVVAYLDGSARKGVILGGIRHPARQEQLEANGTPAYISRMNGIEKKISEEGALTYTYKGKMPNDEALLKTTPGLLPVTEATDDPARGGSNFGFDAEGNFMVADGEGGGSQSIVIKKALTPADGDITITSGSTVVRLAGSMAEQVVSIETLGDMSISATKSFSVDTLDCEIAAKNTIHIDALVGVKIQAKGMELLDLITQLIDEMGSLVINSPDGPCAPFNSAPTWTKVMMIQQKIKQMIG